jgi:hypothetical protein
VFRIAYNDLHDGLLNEVEIDAVCVHEAGHEIYFQEAGFDKCDRNGPRIIYKPPSLISSAASVTPRKPKIIAPLTAEWLFLTAKACAAGGVYSRLLMPCSKRGGDGEDIERLQLIYRTAQVPLLEETWKHAQDIVKKELEGSLARQKFAWTRANEIKNELFGYLFRPSSQQ